MKAIRTSSKPPVKWLLCQGIKGAVQAVLELFHPKCKVLDYEGSNKLLVHFFFYNFVLVSATLEYKIKKKKGGGKVTLLLRLGYFPH